MIKCINNYEKLYDLIVVCDRSGKSVVMKSINQSINQSGQVQLYGIRTRVFNTGYEYGVLAPGTKYCCDCELVI